MFGKLTASLTFLTLALALLAPTAASAQEEYRRIQMSNGRVLTGLVLESNDDGMILRVPQGKTLASYEGLADIGLITKEEFEAQPAIRVAITPVYPATAADTEMAASIDAWSNQAAGLMPATEIIAASLWKASTADQGVALIACKGEASCLLGQAGALGADFLISLTLSGSGGKAEISVSTIVAATGRTIATTRAAASASAEQGGRALVEAIFGSMTLDPEVDVATLAALAFPPTGGPVATKQPKPKKQPTAKKEPKPKKQPTAKKEPRAKKEPKVIVHTDAPLPLGKVLVFGLLPVPGLNSALQKDLPGFIISVVGIVGASWASIYAIGATAREAGAFWAPTLITPYLLNIAFNTIDGLVGYKRLYGKTTVSGKAAARPQLRPALAPVLTRRDGETEAGAGFFLLGRF